MVKTVIVEDGKLNSCALRDVIKQLGHQVTGIFDNGHDALIEIPKLQPHFLLVDYLLPHMDGLELSKKLLSIMPKLKILVISSECDPFTIFNVFEADIHGFIDRIHCSEHDLKNAITLVLDGKRYFSPLSEELREKYSEEIILFKNCLTKKEKLLAPFFCQTYKNIEIANMFNLSEHTVQRHRQNVMRKFNVDSVKELIRFGIINGIWKYRASVDYKEKGLL